MEDQVPGIVQDRPEIADVARLARRLLGLAVTIARTEDQPARRLLYGHLGPRAASLPVATGSWPAYEQVNVQAGLDAWLATPGRSHEIAGLTGFRHMEFGMAELIQGWQHGPGLGLGSVATDVLPAGPGGATRTCVRCGLYLVDEGGARSAMLLRAPEHAGEVTLEVATGDRERAERVLREVRDLALARSVYRGQVLSFGGEMIGPMRGGPRGPVLSFLDRPRVDRDQVILPPDVLEGIERQVLGVARHAARLAASGQHLKRGVLLHGVPGTGKSHTVRYLISHMPDVTVVVLSGVALHMIGEACSVARALQPALIVVEDVDLIAEQRGPGMGWHPLLFQLLNEMDGLGEDIDVTFLLTTNRADVLETALAERPGRVDHAAELPVPDADARRRLMRLYQGNLVLDLSNPEAVISRTEGVTASFIKELLRRAALNAAEEETRDAERDRDDDPAGAADHAEGVSGGGSGQVGAGGAARRDGPLRVTDSAMNAALDSLLSIRSQLTRTLLGGRSRDAATGGETVVSAGPPLPPRAARRLGWPGPPGPWPR